jgi:hypothetical protein
MKFGISSANRESISGYIWLGFQHSGYMFAFPVEIWSRSYAGTTESKDISLNSFIHGFIHEYHGKHEFHRCYIYKLHLLMMTFTYQNLRELGKTMENSGRSIDGIVKSHGFPWLTRARPRTGLFAIKVIAMTLAKVGSVVSLSMTWMILRREYPIDINIIKYQ